MSDQVNNTNVPVQALPRNLVKRRDKIDKAKQEIGKLKATVSELDYELKKAAEAAREYRPTNNSTPIRPNRLPYLKAQLAYLEAQLKLAPIEIEYHGALNIIASKKKAEADKHLHEVEAELGKEYGLEVQHLGGIRKQASVKWTRAYTASLAAPRPNSTGADLTAAADRIRGEIASCKRAIAAGELQHKREEAEAKRRETPPKPPRQLLDMQRDIARGERHHGDPQSLLE